MTQFITELDQVNHPNVAPVITRVREPEGLQAWITPLEGMVKMDVAAGVSVDRNVGAAVVCRNRDGSCNWLVRACDQGPP